MKRLVFQIILTLLNGLQIFAFLFYYNYNKNIVENLVHKNEQSEIKLKNLFSEEYLKIENYQEKINIEKISKVLSTNKLEIIGWLPDWDIPNSLASVKNNPTKFNSISPVFFWVNEDGTLKETNYTNNFETIKYAKDNNIKLIPTITLFDADILTKLLNNENSFNKHLEEIFYNVDKYGYDGIDIDYESTYLKDKELFLKLLAKLSEGLKTRGKSLSIAVLPKWGDEIIYATLPQTRMVQDYEQIAKYVDEFRLMTYEYTGRGSKYAGPIAPISWMEDVLQYAIYSNVPREKIVLGIHTYSYSYTQREVMPDNLDHYPVYTVEADESKPQALAFFNEDIEVLNLNVTYNSTFQEAVGRYVDKQNQERIVFFPNQEAINARKQLAIDYGLKGVAYWRVGGEGNLTY